MAETTYTYSIANDFPATGLDTARLKQEIQASAIVTALERIDTSVDVCDIVFKDALSAGDKTLLDGDTTNPSGGLIASHTGEPLADSATPITTEVTSADGTPIVASPNRPLGRASYTRTDNGTELINIDGTAAGAADVMWNGTGAGDTGGDWTISTVGTSTGVESTASAKTGTNGWDTTVTTLNDFTVLDNGSMTDIVGTYSELRFWMQPKAYPVSSNFRIRWVDDSNNLVGNQVNVSSYVSNFDLDVWQQVSIPMADFGLTGNVQKLQLRYRAAGGQHFWFDDFDLVNIAGGGPYRFRVAAPAGEIWHLTMAVLMIAAPSSGWNRGAFANISSGLGRGLIVRQRRISTSDVLWRFITKDNVELFGQFHPQEDVTFADGDLLMGFMVKPGKEAKVLITDDDVLEIVVRDDLTLISDMRAYCHYGVEEVA